jgi:hypothetical protein
VVDFSSAPSTWLSLGEMTELELSIARSRSERRDIKASPSTSVKVVSNRRLSW